MLFSKLCAHYKEGLDAGQGTDNQRLVFLQEAGGKENVPWS